MPGPNELDSTLSALAEGQRVFGRYTLGRVLGRGTLGVVWLARDEEQRRNVELKFLPESLARDVVAASDLRFEVQRVQGLNHDAFQRIHDFHEDGARAAISSEFVPGNTLGALCEVRLNGCFDAAELLAWIEPLAEAFTHAHEQLHIVHCALHPGHLVLAPTGRVKVLDFGVAHTLLKAAARHAGGVHTSATLTFSSPQLAAGALPAASDDIYALGATLYDLLAGAPPVLDNSAGRLPIAERRAALNRWGAPIPPAWERTIAACLARDPAQRPASVAVLMKALRDGFVAGHPAESVVIKIDPVEATKKEPAAVVAAAEVSPAPAPNSSIRKSAGPATEVSVAPEKGGKALPPAPAAAVPAGPLPEIEAAQAVTIQRAHHRGALVALICIGVAVWIAREVADRVLPPVLPVTANASQKIRGATGGEQQAPVAVVATPEPSTPLIAAADPTPEPPEPVVPAPSAPVPPPAETPPTNPPPPMPATPAPATPAPATPAPATPTPAPPPPVVIPAPAPATPVPTTPAPPAATPAPKPATPPPATPMPAVPVVTAPTATPPPPPPPPSPSTPGTGPRRVEPVPSLEPPKPGEPWTNSLGMHFVPVPKLSVLVAIWETRSRDFEAFAKAIALHWKPARGGPDYPATDASFLDAMLFCEWLTTAEESAGRLKPGQHYRLPTDAEWSVAAGLPPERGETLRERDDASDKSFPWGTAWPPPPTAGNFRGLNAGSAGANGDIYERAAPVGSFAPNRQGLFDMAGNVAEMVSDFIAPELGLHATRGGSYLDGDRRTLRTRARGVGEDDHGHAPHIGFRMVLDPAPAE